mgnify:FL=1
MDKTKYILLVVAVFILEAVYNLSYAQPPGGLPPGGGASGSEPPCWDPNCVPIDGGVGFLIAAGVALGGKKLYNNYKSNKQDS